MTPRRVIPIVLGGVLLAAAALKLTGTNVTPASLGERWMTGRLQALAVVWELLLGVWLIAGHQRVGAWLASVATFGVFTVISGMAVVLGKSCGCLGRASVPPLGMFVFDLLAVVGLVAIRPAFTLRELQNSWLHQWPKLWMAPLTTLVLIVIIASALYALGAFAGVAPPDDQLQMNRVIDAGSVALGEWRTVSVEVRNLGLRDATIIYGTSNCNCVATDELPLHIPAGESRPVSVQLQFTGSPGAFVREAKLKTGLRRPQWLSLLIAGKVVPAVSSVRE